MEDTITFKQASLYTLRRLLENMDTFDTWTIEYLLQWVDDGTLVTLREMYLVE